MKKAISVLVICIILIGIPILSACKQKQEKIAIELPSNAATVDEFYPVQNAGSVEESDNVNGMRFTLTLSDFTQRYNEIKTKLGQTDFISFDGWLKNGEQKTDEKGVAIQYYYYNTDKTNLTATVETESGKLLNIGVGTTISSFMAQEGDSGSSNRVLEQAAITAEAACGFPTGNEEFLENIFYRITTDSRDSFWYRGFVFSLSTQENKTDSKSSIMLFRVFPISDTLKEEWGIDEYPPTQN